MTPSTRARHTARSGRTVAVLLAAASIVIACSADPGASPRSWFPNDTHFYVVRDDALIVIMYPTDIHMGTDAVLPDGVRDIVAALP